MLLIHRDLQIDEALSSLHILRSEFEIVLGHADHTLSDIQTNLSIHQQHMRVTK